MDVNHGIRRFILTTTVLASVLFAGSRAAADEKAIDSRMAFDRLKTLTGTWDSIDKAKPSRPGVATYSITGGGHVLIETMGGGMSTAYHMDSGQLMLTHYCGAGNQPRMRIKSIEDGGRRISFEIYDITNLASPDAYRSTHLDVVFLSGDRIELAYKGLADGKESTQVFQLTRRKT
jgi:hypothetical protein